MLGYRPEATLPPLKQLDVMRFLTIFKTPQTGSNYVGYVKWTCTYLGLPTSWFGDELQMAIKGARKFALRCSVTSTGVRPLLDESLISRVVDLADARGLASWSCLALVAWEFLLRVQSEALDVQAGEPSDATALPASRHSGS